MAWYWGGGVLFITTDERIVLRTWEHYRTLSKHVYIYIYFIYIYKMSVYTYIIYIYIWNIILTFRNDETCLQFKKMKNYIKTWKISHIYMYGRFVKSWYNASSSWFADLFRPSGTHQCNPKFPKIPYNYASRVLN